MTTTDTTLPPAGWYPDPTPGAVQGDRWWSGVAWTDHTRAARRSEAAPAPAPAVDTRPLARRRAGAAWWALGLGLFTALLAIVELCSPLHMVYISWFGIVAAINGVIALRSSAHGGPDRRAPAIIGIVAGVGGTLIMAAVFFLGAFVRMGPVITDADSVAGSVGAQSDAGPSPTDEGGTGSSPSTPYPAVGLPNWLSTYRIVDVLSTPAASGRCGALVAPSGLPGTFDESDARGVQDYFGTQIAYLRSALGYGSGGAGAVPAALALDPVSRVLYVPATCTALGTVPVGTSVQYGLAPSGKFIAVAFADAKDKVGEVWSSQDDTQYPF